MPKSNSCILKKYHCIGNSGSEGGSALPTYIITVPNIGVNGDGSAFTVYGGALVYMSNGQMMFDVPTIPALSTINQPVSSGFVRPIALWATVSSGTPTYFWTWGDEFDPQFLAPPVFFNNAPAGATMLINGIVFNDTVGTLTIGVDNLTGDFGFNPFRLNGEESIVSNNPAFYYDSGSDSIEIKNDFSISGETFNPGDSLEDDFMQGYVLPAGEGDVWGIGYAGLFNYNLYLFPLSTGVPQGMTLLARVDVNNASPGPWTWGDSLGAVVTEVINYSNSPYLGEWTNLASLSASLIQPDEGNIMLSTAEGLHIYLNGTRVPFGGGGSNNTIAGTASYDFRRFGIDYVPVQMSGGSVSPINTPFFPVQRTVSGAITVVQTEQVTMNPQKVVLINTTDTGDIWCRVLKYNVDTGALDSNGTAGQFDAGFPVDNTIPIKASKVSHDKVAVSYTDTSGNGRVVLLNITADYFNEIRGTTVVATDCGEIRVVEGDWTTGIADLYGISFVFGNKTDNSFYCGGITVDNNWGYQSITINQIDDTGSPITYTAGDVWDAAGCGYRNNTTGAFLFIGQDGYYFDLASGTVAANNLGAAIGPATDIVIKNIGTTNNRWAIGFLFSTYDVRWATANFDGVNLNIGPFQLVLDTDFDRVTARGCFDIHPDENAFVCHFTTIIDDGVQTQVEQTLIDMTGYISTATVIDTQRINIQLQNATYKSISSVLFRAQEMLATYSEKQLSFVFINDLANIISYQLCYGYNSVDNGFRINTGSFLALPQFNKCVGLISGASSINAGASVTVYAKGSQITASTPLTTGEIIYADKSGLALVATVSPLRLGTVKDGSTIIVELEQVTVLPYEMTDGSLSQQYPYGTITLNGHTINVGSLGNISPTWFAPMTIISNQFNSGAIIENVNGTENTGLFNPTLGNAESYIPFGLKGDKITIQKDRDIAWTCYNIIDEDAQGVPIDYATTDADLYNANLVTVPFQYKNGLEFVMQASGAIGIDSIKGFDVGHEFVIRPDQFDVTFTIAAVAGATAGQIIASTGAGTITLDASNGDWAVLRVRDDYVIEVIGVNQYL